MLSPYPLPLSCTVCGLVSDRHCRPVPVWDPVVASPDAAQWAEDAALAALLSEAAATLAASRGGVSPGSEAMLLLVHPSDVSSLARLAPSRSLGTPFLWDVLLASERVPVRTAGPEAGVFTLHLQGRTLTVARAPEGVCPPRAEVFRRLRLEGMGHPDALLASGLLACATCCVPSSPAPSA